VLKKTLLLAALSTIVLALPTAALAQSAGDEEYADPFGPVKQPQDQPGAGNEQPPPVQGQSEGTAPEDLDPVEELPAGPEAGTAQSTDGSDTLPRTGFEAWLFVAIGWWMLLGGIALRRVSTL